MEQKRKLTEVPNCLKQMVRLITRNFESIEESFIIDMIVRYNCVSEKHLKEMLKFDSKTIRAKLTNLRTRKFIQMRTRMEMALDGTPMKVNYYYIHYVNFFNVVKYKFMIMRKKLENIGKASQDYPYLWCSNEKCQKTYMVWEIGECYDDETSRFYCTFCKSPAEENMTTLPKKDAQIKKTKFNHEMKPILDIIKECDDVLLESSLMNPLPYTRVIAAQIKKDKVKAEAEEQAVNITVNNVNLQTISVNYSENVKIQLIEIDNQTKEKLPQVKKELPPWMLQTAADTGRLFSDI